MKVFEKKIEKKNICILTTFKRSSFVLKIHLHYAIRYFWR